MRELKRAVRRCRADSRWKGNCVGHKGNGRGVKLPAFTGNYGCGNQRAQKDYSFTCKSVYE